MGKPFQAESYMHSRQLVNDIGLTPGAHVSRAEEFVASASSANISTNFTTTSSENVRKFYLTNVLPLGIGLVVLAAICIIVTFCREDSDHATDFGISHSIAIVDGSADNDESGGTGDESPGVELSALSRTEPSAGVV